jgi:hypothetical protein
VVDIFRYTEIAEAGAPILNPLSLDKLLLLGELAGLRPGMRQLDLACGKGEMLCQFASRHQVSGVGVDIHEPFIDIARQRAAELGVVQRVDFRVGDAGTHEVDGAFDVVSCIGATWIGGGFTGAVELMKRSAVNGGRLLVGEVFLEHEPPPDVEGRHHGTLHGIADLAGLLDQVDQAGVELTEMVIASREDWDRYSSRHWAQARSWLDSHPDHPEANDVRAWTSKYRRDYLASERDWLGWGVFVLTT